MKTIHEVCKLSGVSRRTLQYYDGIGLLTPCAVTEAGYRQYDDENLLRLWRILFYKELGFSLEDISLLLESPKETEKALLHKHKQILLEKQAQLQKMMASVEYILEGKFDISMLEDFNNSKIEEAKKKYTKEINERMKNGDLFFDFFQPLVQYKMRSGDAFNIPALAKQIPGTNEFDWRKLSKSGEEIIAMFQKGMKEGPDSPIAQDAVIAFQEFVNVLIPCDDKVMRKIGEVYLNQKKDINKKMPGLAEFVNAAIRHRYQ